MTEQEIAAAIYAQSKIKGWWTVSHEIERYVMQMALDEFENCKAHAATAIGLNRTSLHEKMRKLGLLRAKKDE